jgi:arylsulfatase A-like enzyme
MNMKGSPLLIFLIVQFFGPPIPEIGAADRPPNIVLIMADDLGYGDLGCYGNKVTRTPNIDALAAGGLRFTDFHSSGAMCTPTRAATLTGMYQQRFGRKFDGAISGQRDYNSGLPLEAVTIAEVLQKQGYATACFGKWHLGYQPPFLPTNQGFDAFRGLGSGDGDFHTHVDRSGRADWWRDDKLAPESGYTTDLLTRHGVGFIRRNRSQPFFLYIPHLAIHFPWQGPDDPPHREQGKSYHADKWGIIPNPGNVAPHVTAMIESLDRGVGKIMSALKRWKLEENTLVIFTSDNGGYLTYGKNFRNISSNGPLRGQKSQLYEGGHRVPFIAFWPGHIRIGTTGATAHSTDLFQTFAHLAGANTSQMQLDGIDLLPLLEHGIPLPKRTLFWRTSRDRAVREGEWKLCVTGKNAQLYNLTTDLAETNNLAGQFPDRVKKLTAAWDQWEINVNRSARRFEP